MLSIARQPTVAIDTPLVASIVDFDACRLPKAVKVWAAWIDPRGMR